MAPPPLPSGDGEARPPGPHPSFIQVAKPFIFEQEIQECIERTGVSQTKEDSIRLQGVTWIDNVRKALKLYVEMVGLEEDGSLTCAGLFERSTPLWYITINSGSFIPTMSIVGW